jgi:hypothetical protein
MYSRKAAATSGFLLCLRMASLDPPFSAVAALPA